MNQHFHRKREAPGSDHTGLRIAIGAVLLLAILLLNLFTYVFHPVRYYGTGMEPALSGGQTLLILNTRKVSSGDVIAFYYNNKLLVRRVICTGGEQIELDDSGAVFVNGEALDEPYVTEPSLGQCDLIFPFAVPSGSVFVMGDNRPSAMDSRLSEIGTVPADRIYGKVLFVK